MTPELEQRLRAVYPHGYLEAPDLRLYDDRHPAALRALLNERLAPWRMGVDSDSSVFDNERVTTLPLGFFAADHQMWKDHHHPPATWPQRLAETGQPGVVAFLKLCTLYPVWHVNFNRWTFHDPAIPADERRPLDFAWMDEAEAPAPWPDVLAAVSACCATLGLERMSRAELDEPVPFVTRSIWLADDGSDEFPEAEQAAFEERLGFTPSRQQAVCSVEDFLFWNYS